MLHKTLDTLVTFIVISTMALEDPFLVYGQVSEDALEEGRAQYQLLKERGSLPKYGTCWRSAIELVEEGCRYLTEDTQMDVALFLTNCFLEMSGHETYNCLRDKKPNLRAICINNMSDRAFSVYIKFFTHTQNMCWFLRGQLWQEMISENAAKVGKQLATSAENQEEILAKQKESIGLQEKLTESGENLQKIMNEFYISTKEHQEILSVMSKSLQGLQSWLMGEVSWMNSLIFYFTICFLVGIFTSTQRTNHARLPILFLLLFNWFLERMVFTILIYYNAEKSANLLQAELDTYVWWMRKTFLFISIIILLYAAWNFCDFNCENNRLLKEICEQNKTIINYLKDEKPDRNGSVSFVKETNGHCKTEEVAVHKVNKRRALTPFNDSEKSYNLRSRQGTPQIII